MTNLILRIVTLGMCKGKKKLQECIGEEMIPKKQGFLKRLIDDDNNFSTINFFLVAMTFVGIFMLLVPMVGMIVDIIFNRTITVNMSDLGTYILAVSGIFGVAGLSNAWAEHSYNKYNSNIYNNKDNEDCGC